MNMENSNNVQNTTNVGNEDLADVSTRLDFVWKLVGEKVWSLKKINYLFKYGNTKNIFKSKRQQRLYNGH